MASIEKKSTPVAAGFNSWDAADDHVGTAPEITRAAPATTAHVFHVSMRV